MRHLTEKFDNWNPNLWFQENRPIPNKGPIFHRLALDHTEQPPSFFNIKKLSLGLLQQDIETIKRTWGSHVFSNIETLEPNQEFIFLVHAIQPKAIRELRAFELQQEGYLIDQIHLPENPWKVSEKDLISCSVISNKHSETFTDYGFILTAPVECLREAEAEDTNSKPPKFGKSWSWQSKDPSVGKYFKSGPQGLLNDSQGWNEVNLTGTSKHESKKVKPVGIFIKCKNGKLLIDKEDLQTMKRTCIGLPIILMDKQSGQIFKIIKNIEEL